MWKVKTYENCSLYLSCSKLNVLQIFEKKFQKGKFGYIFFGENYESWSLWMGESNNNISFILFRVIFFLNFNLKWESWIKENESWVKTMLQYEQKSSSWNC
jgi:hypothetical protein